MSRRIALVWLETYATSGLLLCCGVLTGIFTARLLLPEGRGALAAILLWPQLLSGFGSMSVHEAITYRTARAETNDRTTATGLWLALGLAIPSLLAGYLLLPSFLGPERAQWVPIAEAYLLAFLPLAFVTFNLLAIDQGQLRYARYNLLRALPSATYLIVLVVLWLSGSVTVETAVLASLSGTIVTAITRLVIGRQELLTLPSWSDATRIFAFGCRFHLAAMVLIVASQVDRIVVISLWNDDAVGIYVVAFTFAASGLGAVMTSFHTILFPFVSRGHSQSAQRSLISDGLRYAMLLLAAGGAMLMIFAHQLIPFLFGEAYASSVTLALILIPAYVMLALRQIAVRSLRGLGESRPGTIAESLSLAVFLSVAWPLGHYLGLAGIGWALLGANVIAWQYMSSYLRSRLDIKVRDWWGLNSSTVGQVTHLARKLLLERFASER